jgi:luciferase family oxidoreductase group 1
VAAATSTIRVGSGGVMLPNHVPLVVAEQFGMLEAIYPGRIDLGIGRAPGTDRVTAMALRRNIDALSDEDFPQQLAELRGYFSDRRPDGHFADGHFAGGHFPGGQPDWRVRAIPAEGNLPAVWLLGSSGYSAQLAGLLGLPFAFAHHFSAANTLPALALYGQTFRPSAVLAEPYCLISVSVVCAADGDRAQWLHGSSRMSMLRLRTGRPSTLPSPEEAARYSYTDAEQAVMAEATVSHVVGDPTSVVRSLRQLAVRTGVDELMVTTSTYAHEDRLESYRLLAEAVATVPT